MLFESYNYENFLYMLKMNGTRKLRNINYQYYVIQSTSFRAEKDKKKKKNVYNIYVLIIIVACPIFA